MNSESYNRADAYGQSHVKRLRACECTAAANSNGRDEAYVESEDPVGAEHRSVGRSKYSR